MKLLREPHWQIMTHRVSGHVIHPVGLTRVRHATQASSPHIIAVCLCAAQPRR